MQMLISTVCQNEEVALHRFVPTNKPRPHQPKTPPKHGCIKTNTLKKKKKRAAHIFTFNSDTDN